MFPILLVLLVLPCPIAGVLMKPPAPRVSRSQPRPVCPTTSHPWGEGAPAAPLSPTTRESGLRPQRT